MSDIHTHPAFCDLHSLVPLSGFSGAYVALIKRTGTNARCVRKAAVLPKDSTRLKDQARLQSTFSASLDGVAQLPSILDEGYIAGCYWYDMDFIPGLDAVEYLSTATPQKVDSFIRQIGEILTIQASKGDSELPPINLQAELKTKLDEIDGKTAGVFKTWTAPLQQILGEVPILLKPNLAHGDLTLENILVDRHETLWLIDTIPSPFNHYWIDLAKLYQDLEGRWFMHRGRNLSVGMTRTISDKIMQQAQRLDPRYTQCHPVLLGLTFARILPYCKTAADTDFVTDKIDLALHMAAKNRE